MGSRPRVEPWRGQKPRNWHVGYLLAMESKRSNVARAEELKDLGNKSFRCHKYALAIELYTRAIELDGHNAVYWANRAYAHIKLEEYASAVQDASRAIELDGAYCKGYYMRGVAYLAIRKFREALRDFQQAMKICPRNLDVAKRMKECENGLMQLQGAIILPEPKPAPAINLRGAIILPEPTPAAKLKGAIVLPEPGQR